MKKTLKNKLCALFELVNPHVFNLVILLFGAFNNLRQRPRLLIFTDSRGFEVTKFWNRKNPFSSYIGHLIVDYSCTVKVCPEKFTSLIDFLDFYESVKHKEFDQVILHCGIVDFAPRPESSFDSMYQTKKKSICNYSLEKIICKDSRLPGAIYQGEVTYSFLNKEALIGSVIPKISEVPNLLYIGINPVLNDWNGNYWRKRPDNINEQLILDEIMCSSLENSIVLSDLNTKEIRQFTSDNVHYTKSGFDYLYSKIKPRLPNF